MKGLWLLFFLTSLAWWTWDIFNPDMMLRRPMWRWDFEIPAAALFVPWYLVVFCQQRSKPSATDEYLDQRRAIDAYLRGPK